MKKTVMLTGALFLFLITATVHAQTDTTQPAQPVQPATTSTDKWNNYSPEKYKMLPMPEALTTEKIFPVIGKYTLTDKDGVESQATLSLDEANKGVVWVDGLPQGRIKAYLMKSPGSYLIPAQKTADEKDLAAGVMVFNKEANTLDVCIGCKYNNEDPASAFAVTEEPVAEEPVAKAKKGTAKTAKTKEKPVKTWKYSGTKIVETTASVTPMQ